MSSGCAARVDEFRKLYEFHSLRSGSPGDFLQLAPKLASSEGFRLDFSDLVRTVRDGERGRLSAAEMLTIVGVAIGGPGVARAEAELYESAGTVQVLLAGVGGWREAGAGPRAERRSAGAEVGGDGSEVAGALLEVSGGESFGAGGDGGPSGNGADGAGRERGWGERADGPSGAASGGKVKSEVNEMLARLELASMQMKVYLDDIDRRMGRIEPHLEGLTAMVQTSTERFDRIGRDGRDEGNEGQRDARLGAGETAGRQPGPAATGPEAAGPGRRRRSEEIIAAAMERSAGARNGFGAGAVEASVNGRESGVAEPGGSAPEDFGGHANSGLAEAVAERWRRSTGGEARGGDAPTELRDGQEAAGKPEEAKREIGGEPKGTGSELPGSVREAGAQPRFIRYEAPRVAPRGEARTEVKEGGQATGPVGDEIGREAVSEAREGGQETPPARKEIGREAADKTKENGKGAGAAAARVLPEVVPEAGGGLSVASPAQVEARVPAGADLPVPASRSAPVAAGEGRGRKRPQWGWGATAAALLVAASVIALYGPWHLPGGRVEVAGAGPGSGVAAAPAAEGRVAGVRAETAVAGGGLGGGVDGGPGGGSGGGFGGASGGASGGRADGGVSGIAADQFGNGSGGGGRSGAVPSSRGVDRGGAGPQSGGPLMANGGGANGGAGDPSTIAPTAVQGSGGTGGAGAKESAGVPPALPASAGMSGAAPSGAVEAPKSQVVAVRGEAAPRNRVEGARAEDPSRVARGENLHPEDPTERAAGGNGTGGGGGRGVSAETGAMTGGAPAPGTGGPAVARVSPAPSASGGPAGGGRDVPRALAGRPEVTPGMVGGTVLSAPAPIYPQQARQLGLEGQVVIRATVNKAGAVTGMEVIKGPVLLQQSAQDAVRRRRYKPFLLRGEPVEFQTMVTLIYRLGK